MSTYCSVKRRGGGKDCVPSITWDQHPKANGCSRAIRRCAHHQRNDAVVQQRATVYYRSFFYSCFRLSTRRSSALVCTQGDAYEITASRKTIAAGGHHSFAGGMPHGAAGDSSAIRFSVDCGVQFSLCG